MSDRHFTTRSPIGPVQRGRLRRVDVSSEIRPLAGVRVLELGNYIAAPTAGRILGDFGVERMEVDARPGTGDELRNWRLYGGSTSMLYRTVNRNKKSIVLDLRTEAGRGVVLDLLRHCDVLLENFRPGTLEKWGLGPAVLDEANQDLVITRISAFGQTGPLAQRPGFAAVAEAVGGLRGLVGDPDRPPVRVGVSIGDSIAGIYAAFGTVMALFQRDHSASQVPVQQRIIDVALNEAILSVMESLVPDYLAYGINRQRVGGQDGRHRPVECVSMSRRDEHHYRWQRRRDLPALHAHDRARGTRRRSEDGRQRRALGTPRRTRRRDRRVDDPHPREDALRILDEAGKSRRSRSTPPPTSARTNSTRRET